MPRPDPARIEQALAAVPPGMRARLSAALADGFGGAVAAADAEAFAREMGGSVPDVMQALVPLAAAYAAPPISRFHVGAVARGATGALYLGANMEFAGQALSVCTHAEQSAVANAWAHGEPGVRAIAVSAAPCGYCRQFLYELGNAETLEILLPGKAPAPLPTLLPAAFGPRDLGVDGALLGPARHGLALDPPPSDPVARAALAAADRSYAPYSRGYAGIALETADGRMHVGMLAENAAFNPSMSPLEGALSALNLHGGEYADIRRAVLVEAAGAATRQEPTTRDVLASVTDVPLEVFRAKEPS